MTIFPFITIFVICLYWEVFSVTSSTGFYFRRISFYAIIGEQAGALYSYAYIIYAIFLSISTAGIPTAISKLTSEYETLDMKEAKTRMFYISIKFINYLSIVIFLLLIPFSHALM